jgi:RNA polymerase sigma-70 factor (ECF subfamily)
VLIAAEDRLHKNDSELAQRIATGDTAALELLMRRNNQMLYRAARSILKNDEEAEEAVQDAYLKAYRAMGSYRGDAKLSTWLTRLTINEALARARKYSRRAKIVLFDGNVAMSAESQEAISMQVNTVDSPDRALQRADVRRLIESNIDKLPDAFRCVFMLRALQEMSVEETASCLNIPEATVRTRYFRARGLLRESMAQEIDMGFEDAFGFAGARCNRIVNAVLTRIEAAPPFSV